MKADHNIFETIYRDSIISRDGHTSIEPEVYCFEDYHPCTAETYIDRQDYPPCTTENTVGSQEAQREENSVSEQMIDRLVILEVV